MDKTETYVKMCDCPEIQDYRTLDLIYGGRYWAEGDYYWLSEKVNDYYSLSSRPSNYYNAIWLPRQDQLQEMCWELTGTKWTPFFALTMVRDFANENRHGETMEQLWLAFVMKEKFNKVWEDGKWQEVPA